MYANILVATDGSALATRAVEHGARLARALNAELSLLTVTEQFHVFAIEADQLEETPTSFRRHMKKQADRVLATAANVAANAGIQASTVHVEDDSPSQAILRVADSRECDLIVMASHGRAGVPALLLGSHTMKVLSLSKVPVLVVR